MNSSPPTPKTRLVVICGPTGIGKTDFAIELALRFKGQIIGADSMQIYRHLEIGTAKPTPSQRRQVPHHLVDFLEPDRQFDAASYARRATAVVNDLDARNIPAFVVGGTGLYIKALLKGIFQAEARDPVLRERLKQKAKVFGKQVLYNELAGVDPETAARLHPNDTYRVIRALEVFYITGTPLSAHHKAHGFRNQRFRALKIGLTMDRRQLYARIEKRVDLMISRGLLEEVEGLLCGGFGPHLKAMQSLGYRQMTAYIDGEISWQEAVALIKRDHRRYAKRQFTWFRADPEILWLAPDQIEKAAEAIAGFLE